MILFSLDHENTWLFVRYPTNDREDKDLATLCQQTRIICDSGVKTDFWICAEIVIKGRVALITSSTGKKVKVSESEKEVVRREVLKRLDGGIYE